MKIYNNLPRIFVVPLIVWAAFFIAGCKQHSVDTHNIRQVDYHPLNKSIVVITNSSELDVIGEWLNETLKSPLSHFDIKSYPSPIHLVEVKLNSGKIFELKISNGGNRPRPVKKPKPGLIEGLTIVSYQGRLYMAKTCPESLVYHPATGIERVVESLKNEPTQADR